MAPLPLEPYMGAISLLFSFYLLFISTTSFAASIASRNVQVDNLLKRLNKPYVKSINSPDRDIVDCVDIYHQPAFSHPLLHNHTIQVLFESNQLSQGVNASIGRGEITQTWHKNGSCPIGTIPIIRTSRKNVLRASFVGAYGKKTRIIDSNKDLVHHKLDSLDGHEFALAYVEGKYYGAKSFMNVWNPAVLENEMSTAQVWVIGDDGKKLNAIEAGWHVHPHLNGDHQTRLFIYWTSDNFESNGCYNLKCPGFVQISGKYSLGGSISPTSTYDGAQTNIIINIWKDLRTANWFLQVNDEVMGYWPSSLFTSLADSASQVHWGGEIFNSKSDRQHTATQMGNGHFPEEGYKRAAFIRNLEIVDASHVSRPVKDLKLLEPYKNCYRVSKRYNNPYGNHIYFGGLGRNPKCP